MSENQFLIFYKVKDENLALLKYFLKMLKDNPINGSFKTKWILEYYDQSQLDKSQKQHLVRQIGAYVRNFMRNGDTERIGYAKNTNNRSFRNTKRLQNSVQRYIYIAEKQIRKKNDKVNYYDRYYNHGREKKANLHGKK